MGTKIKSKKSTNNSFPKHTTTKKKSKKTTTKSSLQKDKNTKKMNLHTFTPSSRILVIISSTLFITIGTIIAIYFIRGYRITFNGVGEKTGVISVNSNPAFATVFLDNKSIGLSPQTEALISQGIHNVQIKKKGYITWDKNIEVVEGKATPISVPLFINTPEAEVLLKGEDKIIKIFNDQNKENIFIVTSKDVHTNDKQNIKLITIQKYITQTQFWQKSNNPTLLFEKELPADNIPEISSSFNGKYLLLEFPNTSETNIIKNGAELEIVEIENPIIQPIVGTYILDTNGTSTELLEIPTNLQSISLDYQWSIDNTLLIITKDVLLSLEVPSFKQEILLTGDLSTIIYSIDNKGNLYYLRLTEAQTIENYNEPAYYSIIESSITGDETKAIDKIYFNKTDKYLKSDIDNLQIPFNNSPENYRFAGKILDFLVNTKAKSVIIKTEFALYHYNLKTKKYTVISTGPAEFISFSPDLTKLLYKNDIGIGIFTFEKETADYISTLGSEILLITNDQNEIKQITWHKSSEIILYQDQNGTNIIDLDGAYNHKLTSHTGFSMTDSEAEILYTLEQSNYSNAFSLNMFILR